MWNRRHNGISGTLIFALQHYKPGMGLFFNSVSLEWVMPDTIEDFFRAWGSVGWQKNQEAIFNLICAAVIWSIWINRNDKIFNDKVFCPVSTWESAKYRAWTWIRAAYGNSFSMDATNFTRNIGLASIQVTRKPAKVRNVVWIQPSSSSEWRINVDGSRKSSTGLAGVGGVIRDGEGNIIYILSKCIGNKSSNEAEVTAISSMVSVLKLSCGFPLPKISFLSDSINSIAWIEGNSQMPWELSRHIEEIRVFSKQVNAISFRHIYREANAAAYYLAKRGADGASELSGWC